MMTSRVVCTPPGSTLTSSRGEAAEDGAAVDNFTIDDSCFGLGHEASFGEWSRSRMIPEVWGIGGRREDLLTEDTEGGNTEVAERLRVN